MSINRPIQLGLCCVNTKLRIQTPPVFASRKMIIRTVKEHGIDCLKDKIIQNLKDVLTMMDWNEQNGIKVFRLSSELFPHKSNPKVESYTFDFAKDLLYSIGQKARDYNQRLTFHPGQYNVIGSPNKKYFQQTCADLEYHANVLELCSLDGLNPVMVVHGGGIYGNKQETIKRWCEQYAELSDIVRKYLVLENCEKCFSIEDCLFISQKTNIPVVFDTHHYECYRKLHPQELIKPAEEYIPDILYTWKKKQLKPKFHVSEQGLGRIGHHSDFVQEIPHYLLDIPQKYGIDIDIMIEAKMKEQAIEKLYIKYPFLNCLVKKNIDVVVNNPSTDLVHKYCTETCCKKRKKLIIKDSLIGKNVMCKMIDTVDNNPTELVRKYCSETRLKKRKKLIIKDNTIVKSIMFEHSELDKNFKKCVKGFHFVNSCVINETTWEYINETILLSLGVVIYYKSNGGHASGMDIDCSIGKKIHL